MPGVYDFSARSLSGEDVALQRFEGQVLLIVNTASACGFTPQYQGLEALQRELAPRGFSVLGFPCNQFGGQEPVRPPFPLPSFQSPLLHLPCSKWGQASKTPSSLRSLCSHLEYKRLTFRSRRAPTRKFNPSASSTTASPSP
jgi:hypothetical protein